MSQENVEVVRSFLATLSAREVAEWLTGPDAPWDLIDPDVEWVIDPAAFVAGTYRGHEGIRRMVGLLAEAFDRWEFVVDNYIDAGDSVVALGRAKIHGGRSGVTAGQPLGYTFRVRDGASHRLRPMCDPTKLSKLRGCRSKHSMQ